MECHQEFIFTAGEQLFYHNKNLKNEPKRCKACKAKRAGMNGATTVKVETQTECSQCGRPTTIPFKPTQGRPVYCRECFQQRRGALSQKPASAT
jgi:CxxC-x17-CxxC domain-containing protein